jgi:hypothetical protein
MANDADREALAQYKAKAEQAAGLSAKYNTYAAGANMLSTLFNVAAAQEQAKMYKQQARLLIAETEADIDRYRSQTRAFQAHQKLMYLKSGVSVSGTPLEILAETARTAVEDVSAMRAAAKTGQRTLRQAGSEAKIKSWREFSEGIAGLAKTQYG